MGDPATTTEPNRNDADMDRLRRLSARQRDTIRMLCQGLETGAIADHLGLSRNTVANHLYNAKGRLGMSNLADLTRWAQRVGLVKAEARS